jgi:hypothetical protein
MIGNQTLTELLLIESPKLVQMTASLNGILMKFIPAIFTFAIVIEYFNGMNWGTLVKRLFISTFILAFYTSAHIEFIKGAITIAEKGILSKTNGNVDASYFKMNKKDLRNIEEVKNRETKRAKKNESFGKSLLTKFTIVPRGALYISILYKYWFKSLTDRALPDFTTLFVWISFLFVKLLFSAVYHMTYVFAGIVALLYLFEFGAKSLTGMLVSTIWCMIMPMVVCASIFFLRESIGGTATSGGGIGNIALVIVSSAFFLFTPYIALKLIQGGGVVSGIAQFGNMISAGALYLGGSALLGASVSKFKSGKSLISSSADNIRGNRESTLGHAASHGLRSGEGLSASGLSNSEKMILGADRLLRPIATGKKDRAVKRAATKLMNEGGYSPNAKVNFNGGEKINPSLPIANRINQALVGVRPEEPTLKDPYGSSLRPDGSIEGKNRRGRRLKRSSKSSDHWTPDREKWERMDDKSRGIMRKKFEIGANEKIEFGREYQSKKFAFNSRNKRTFGMDVVDEEIERDMQFNNMARPTKKIPRKRNVNNINDWR